MQESPRIVIATVRCLRRKHAHRIGSAYVDAETLLCHTFDAPSRKWPTVGSLKKPPTKDTAAREPTLEKLAVIGTARPRVPRESGGWRDSNPFPLPDRVTDVRLQSRVH